MAACAALARRNRAARATYREAPADRVPRVIEGVVRRSAIDGGDPREAEIGGDDARFLELLHELDPEGTVVGMHTTQFVKAGDGEPGTAEDR